MRGKEMSIIIAGGGLTGLTMAASLDAHNIPVTLIAPDLNKKKKDDKRSTAIMMEGIDLLSQIDVWNACKKETAPLKTMRIINGSKKVDFHAQEMNKEAFAINVPNTVLLKSLMAKIKTSKNITCVNAKISHIDIKENSISVTTDKKKTITADLLIGADGRQSIVRQSHNIKAQSHDFKQKALVCVLEHTKPHHNASTEIHRAGGPFTLVPLPNNQSALVWCDYHPIIDDVMTQPKKDQQDLIQRIVGRDILGDVTIISQRQSWPIHALKTSRLVAKRSALIGEAAHALAPIAAQGFNLSLRDINSLTEKLVEAQRLGLDFGSNFLLQQYQQDRKSDIALRYHSVGILNTLIANTSLPASILKAVGLSTMEWISPLRHFAMRFGMRA